MCKPRVFVLFFLVLLISGCGPKGGKAPQVIPQKPIWTPVSLPFRPRNISAVGRTIWVCGDNEGIARSFDAGATWAVTHSNPHGQSLIQIGFVNEKVGHAAGGKSLLSTMDGGRTWKSQDVAGTVRQFSFADESTGIIEISDEVLETNGGMLDEVQGSAAVDGVVKITHDAGEDWEDVSALRSDERLRAFADILFVAALNPSHYLVSLRQPQVAVGYAVTNDAGKSWSLVQLPDTYATRVYVHEGEYWAFGIEYLNREDHGGYGAPVALHSADGEKWVHGLRGPHEFATCTPQGCSLWDGLVEDLYGQTVKFWTMPEYGKLNRRWALSGNRVCAVDEMLICAPASETEVILPMPARPRVQ